MFETVKSCEATWADTARDPSVSVHIQFKVKLVLTLPETFHPCQHSRDSRIEFLDPMWGHKPQFQKLTKELDGVER